MNMSDRGQGYGVLRKGLFVSVRLCCGELYGVGDIDRGVKLEELAEGKTSESSEDSSPRKNLGELEEAL